MSPTTTTETVCPQCATLNLTGELVPHADNFCSECDFPLFWDQQSIPVLSDEERTDDALRRLPGVGGRDSRRMRACPACAEPNPLGNDNCMRCGSLMELPVVVEVEETVVAIYDPADNRPGRDWLLIGLVVFVMALVAFLVAYGIAA